MAVIASRASLSAVQAVSPDEDAADRWRQWQLRNAEAHRSEARRMRLVFMGLFAVLGMWLAFELLAASLGP